MEEQQKTADVVEQRLSRGVIRRRARPVAAPTTPKEEPKRLRPEPETVHRVAETPVVSKPVPAPLKPVKQVTEQAVAEPASVNSNKPEVVEQEQPAVQKPGSKFVLSEEQKTRALKLLQKQAQPEVTQEQPQQSQQLQQPETSPVETSSAALMTSPSAEVEAVGVLPVTDVPLVAETPAVPEAPAVIRVLKKEPPKKAEEKPRILSFKDRIRGHIDLKKVQVAKPSVTSKQPVVPVVGDLDDEATKDKKEKAAKAKKGVKAIGGDLDIEGLGRTTHLTQLTRTAPLDRIFRPGEAKGRKKKLLARKNIKQTVLTQKKASKRVIEMETSISVGALAQELGVKAGEIIKKLMELGIMATINKQIDKDTVTLIAGEYEYEVRDVSFKEADVIGTSLSKEEETVAGSLRPPVVTVMGHVDHGKTSLLDAIRSTDVASGEAGGITQHIGAYTVNLPQGRITFLDTPGHEAFTTMRLRGAQATDIVVLVVAADDGVMPQTEESINHAKAAGVPIIVAVNKIDKPQTDLERVKRQLAEKGLVPEEWGGDTIYNHVSAKQGTGISELLANILLQAEMLDLKACEANRASGIVLEAKLDRARGPLCTLLVQNGTLKNGDFIVAGMFAGRVRSMYDWKGTVIEVGSPSTAVEVLGLEGVPDAGDAFNAVASDQDARSIVDHRIDEKQRKQQEPQSSVTLEDMFSRMKAGEINELSILLKTDVQGSLEAVRDAVLKLGNEEVKAKIVHAGVGGINESDVRLAVASKAIIIGFNVRPETKALHLAKEARVDVKMYKIIYELVSEVKLAMQGLLAPEIKENYLGRAEVRQTFEVSKVGTIAGSMVTDGMVTRTSSLRVLRDNVVVFEGAVASLKRVKDDAREVKQGFECGIGIAGFNDLKAGDVIEFFEIQKIQKTL